MAREASIAVGGYFPTPPHIVPMIGECLRVLPGDHRIFDPCAGEGAAILGILPFFEGEGETSAFAVEMERTRSLSLRKAFLEKYGEWHGGQRVAHGDCFALDPEKISENFTFLYLNPPYDTDPVAGRLEERFLRRFLPTLATGGVLCFVVPVYALEASMETLGKHCTDLRCFAFPEKDFAVYKQVILFGVKRPSLEEPDPRVMSQIRDFMKSPLPVIGEDQHVVPVIPYRGWATPTLRIRPIDVDSVSAAYQPWMAVSRSGKLHPLTGAPTLNSVEDALRKTYPMAMPPKVSHIAMAVAAGIFNGSVVTPDDPDSTLPPLLVKGAFDKEWVPVEEKKNKDGETIGTKEIQQPKLTVSVFDLKWNTFHTLPSSSTPSNPAPLLASEMNVADLLTLYGKSLMRVMMASCPVQHDPANDKDRFPLVPTARTFYRAQEEVIRANVKLLGGKYARPSERTHKYAFLLGELGSGKTGVALSTGLNIGAKKMLVVCPPHLLAEWQSEIKKVVPTATATILDSVDTVSSWAGEKDPETFSIGILSRETAKLGHGVEGLTVCPKCGTVAPAGIDTAKKRYRCAGFKVTPKNDMAAVIVTAVEKIAGIDPGNASFRQVVRRSTIKRIPFVGKIHGAHLIPVLVNILSMLDKDLTNSAVVINHLRNLTLALVKDFPEEVIRTLRFVYGVSLGDISNYGSGQTLRDFARESVFLFASPETREGLLKELASYGQEKDSGYYANTSYPFRGAWLAHREKMGEDISSERDSYLTRSFKGFEYNKGVVFRDNTEAGSLKSVVTAVEALISAAALQKSKPCGEFLFSATAEPRRFPLAKYILRYFRNCFDFLVLDECQDYSGKGSAQEKAAHRLTEIGKPTLLMTGTGMNGYASSLFANLWGCNREFRKEFDRSEEQAFVDRYGYRTRIVEPKEKKEGMSDYGSVTDREMSERITGNAPGVLPVLVLKWLLPTATTLHKTDLEASLPPLTQEKVEIDATPEMLQESMRLFDCLIKQIRKDQFDEDLSGKLFGAMAQLPSYLDLCTKDTGNVGNGRYEIRYPESVGGGTVTEGISYPASTILPKEEWMIRTVKEHLANDNHVMVFAWHRDLLPRLKRILEAALFEEVALLDPVKVSTAKRRAWIDKEVVKKGRRVLVVNPMAIQTGLNNLVGFSTILVMENPAVNPTIYRQAVGRIDRIGQTKPTTVLFPVYRNSMQATAHRLLFTKVAVAQTVDGVDATSSLNAAGVGEMDTFASMSIGKALAEMYLQDL